MQLLAEFKNSVHKVQSHIKVSKPLRLTNDWAVF